MPGTDTLIGQCVSHYRVVEKLGGGGMGVVYKAEDLQLRRSVSLKFLTEHVASDPQALGRFRREAQTASALNHPNICTIYEICEQNTPPFIAMEFLEGHTLKERIETRSLATEQVMEFAIQIADALEAAHSVGVIHRDMKPSNILITKRGQVKILDFGLAKMVRPDADPVALQAPTITEDLLTNPGSVMGTLTYMSPEQARGQELDARTDLFSFGAVLYEMTTGRRAFPGSTIAIVHDAILNRAPLPVARLKPGIPTRLEEIIAKLLEKDRELRYRSAAEVRIDLQRLRRDTPSASAPIPQTESIHTLPESIRTPTSRRASFVAPSTKWLTAAALLGVILVAFVFYLHRQRVLVDRTTQTAATLVSVPFTTLKGQEVMPAFSPDGSQIVFAWDGGKSAAGDQYDLFVKVVGTENMSRLTFKPSTWLAPAWSPDGQTIAFARKSGGDSGIFEVSAIGGPERKLAPAAFTYTPPMSISWSNDGKSLAYADGDGVLHLLDHGTGEVSTLIKPAQCARAWSPIFSPTEARIAFLCERNNIFLVFVIRPDGTGARQVTTENAGPQDLAWSADGKRVLLTDNTTGQLVQADVDRKSVSTLPFTQDAFQPATSRRGDRLAYARSFENTNIWAINLDPANHEPRRLLVSSTRMQKAPDISPDGKRIAFESDRTGAQEIWISSIDGSSPVQLSHFNQPLTGSPRWSPSGRLIAFDSRAGGQASVYLVDPDGGIPKRLATSIDDLSIPTWSRDGNFLYVCFAEVGRGEIYRIPVQGGDPQLIVKLPHMIANAQESRDGRWLYFAKGAAQAEVRVVSVNGGLDRPVEGMPVLSDSIDWALADNGIYFINRIAGSSTICFYDLATKRIRQIAALEKSPPEWGGLSLSRDGKWLAYSQIDDTPSDIMLVNHFR